MLRLRSIRFYGLILAASSLGSLLLLIYFAVTSPTLPYEAWIHVQAITQPAQAGDLQPGDEIQIFDGKPIYGCLYLLESPVYSAPRNRPVALDYQRPGVATQRRTEIILTNPTLGELLSQSPNYILAAIFVLTGVIILAGGTADWAQLAVGFTWAFIGLTIAAWAQVYRAPLLILSLGGLPVCGLSIVATHTFWPVNQLHRRLVRVVLGITVIKNLAVVGALFFGASWFSCELNPTKELLSDLSDWFYYASALEVIFYLSLSDRISLSLNARAVCPPTYSGNRLVGGLGVQWHHADHVIRRSLDAAEQPGPDAGRHHSTDLPVYFLSRRPSAGRALSQPARLCLHFYCLLAGRHPGNCRRAPSAAAESRPHVGGHRRGAPTAVSGNPGARPVGAARRFGIVWHPLRVRGRRFSNRVDVGRRSK